LTQYLDSSITIDAITGKPALAWDRTDHHCFSELGGIEARRTLQRLQFEGALDDERFLDALQQLVLIEQTAEVVEMDRQILQRAAAPFPTAIKTLDAIHLATAMTLREYRYPDLVFATHDRRLGMVAQMVEFPVVGVG
jgi:predicted nucleic acid-binding protein